MLNKVGSTAVQIGGPFFEDLRIGQTFEGAPALTLTEGLAAVHTSILGERLRLALDREMSARVSGGPLAPPALVWNAAIGQSTLVTQRVIANLFYRGFMFRRFPRIGDTLRTTTEVIALRQNRSRPGRAATGLAVLRMRTTDQNGQLVLDFWRCAMLPLRDPAAQTSHMAELAEITANPTPDELQSPVRGWQLDLFRAENHGQHFSDLTPGTIWEVVGGDVVSSAPELARLTLNIAMVHHDNSVGAAGRLIYGGHTIGLAAAQATRALTNLVTIVAWHSCDHTAPVREGDTLRSTLELENMSPFAEGGGLVHLRSRVSADRDGGPQNVLDWRFVGVMA